MVDRILCGELKALMDSSERYALLDVRERGEYNAGQIYTATSLPRRQIEFSLTEVVPSPRVPVIVYDDAGERAPLAAATIKELGYGRVRVLDGGLPAWGAAGYPTITGVNVPSKEFGEKVHIERHVPEITPEELNDRRGGPHEPLILDARTPEEYRRFCIPGGLSVPGGDLVLWAEELKRKTDTMVVVNCAGRTRSVIGTATLRRLGLSNVRALKNGAMGWVLAGLELERGSTREPPSPSPSSRAQAEVSARRVAAEEGIAFIAVPELLSLRGNGGRHVHYLLDVRSDEEYAAGHIPGSVGTPGGQAVQRTDDFVAVRGAKVVFVSDGVARAVMAAYWFRGMGFKDVAVLEGGVDSWVQAGQSLARGGSDQQSPAVERARPSVRFIGCAELARGIESRGPVVLNVGTSQEFAAGHVPGSRWISRGWLEMEIERLCPDRGRAIVVTCPTGQHSILAARTLGRMGYTDVSALEGGVDAWTGQGRPSEKGLEGCVVEPNDVVIAASASGDREKMERYLEWELALGRKFEK